MTGLKPLIIAFGFILIGCGCKHGQGAPKAAMPSAPAPVTATIAEELLTLEMGTQTNTVFKERLEQMINSAAARFGNGPEGETEEAKAARFFHGVDRSLIEENFIFPPNGLIDLLRNALTPRTLSEDEYTAAMSASANRRRLAQLQQNFKNKGTFYFVDCDLSAIIYKAVGERLGLPIEFIEVPKHNFVRWSSPALRMNWDTNDGRTYSDDEYARQWKVTEVGRTRIGWLNDMSRSDIKSYWWRVVGNWHKRHGRYHEARGAFNSAMNASPGNLESANELAWFLATCSDAEMRNGREASTIAERVVAVAPRANWIDTLAAAQAETGRFDTAVATELRAKEAAGTSEWGISAADQIAGFDKCIEAYRKNLTYRQAVNKGLIEDPKENLPYDD